MKNLFILSLLSLSLACVTPAARADETATPQKVASPKAAVVKLATFFITPTPKTYRFNIKNCGKDIKQIKMKITKAGVRVGSVGLMFEDGSRRDFNINKAYEAGTESKWYSLALFRVMDPRCPTQIFADGNSLGGTAKVDFYGTVK